MEEKETNLPQPLNIVEKIKWSTVREFFAFIFGALMYLQNKGLVSDIQAEKKQDKEYYRQEKREDNQTLRQVLTTMDDVIKFKKSANEKDTNFYNSYDSAGNPK